MGEEEFLPEARSQEDKHKAGERLLWLMQQLGHELRRERVDRPTSEAISPEQIRAKFPSVEDLVETYMKWVKEESYIPSEDELQKLEKQVQEVLRYAHGSGQT